MLTERELEKMISKMLDRLDTLNTAYITKIAEQIKRIGTLIPSQVNRMVEMAAMGANVAEINEQLAAATALNFRDIQAVYSGIMQNAYTDPRFAQYITEHPVPQDAKNRVARYTLAVSRQTQNKMLNLSNTTLVSAPYQQAVDRAILSVGSGVTDYKTAMRDTIRELGGSGLQVQYPSGFKKRLDSAVRQNIIDGANQIQQQASLMIGEALGYNAIELTAHARSAPDHEPVQGRVFMLDQFELMQSGADFEDVDGNRYAGFRRPIGEWNCMHLAMSFDTRHSRRRYTPEELDAFKATNNAGCDIGGKHYTIYQAVQLMRRIETSVRRQKDTAIAAQAAGDDQLRTDCQRKINSLAAFYSQVAKAAGVTPRKDRMAVEGFRAIKVK